MKKVFTGLLLMTLFLPLYAQSLRVIVLPKMTIENKEKNASALESNYMKVLKNEKIRVVELGAALAAQKVALSDAVNEGKIPKELSVLNADLVIALQLECSKNSDGIAGSSLRSYFCSLNMKSVRLDSGDVVSADADNFNAVGLNASQAINTKLKDMVPEVAAKSLAKWKQAFSGEGAWDMDVFVSGVSSRKKTVEITKMLEKYEGVDSANIIMFKKDLLKLSLSGSGKQSLDEIKTVIESDDKLNLKITYDAGRMLHVKYDFAKANARRAASYLVLSGDKMKKAMEEMISQSGTGIIDSSLMNMPYFQSNSTELTKMKKKALVKKAASANLPLLIINNLSKRGESWMNIIEVVHTASGKTIASGQSADSDPFNSIDIAVRKLDNNYRKAMARDDVIKKLSYTKDVSKAAVIRDMEFSSFSVNQIFPVLLPYYQKKGVGQITIKNVSGENLKDMEVRYFLNDKVAGNEKIASLSNGKTVKLSVKLNFIPKSDVKHSQLKAEITYKKGETYGKSDAYTSMVVHSPDTIDWSMPEMIAPFINPGQSQVRTLATKALRFYKEPFLLTKQLTRAALVYETLWGGGLKYVADPVDTSFNSSIDKVQTPSETLERKAGDCDDLTVLLASLFESVGLATVIITTPGHVFLGVESGVLGGGNVLYNLPADAFIEVDGALYVPVEATAVKSSFAEAWIKSAGMIKEAGKDVHTFRVRKAWKKYSVKSSDKKAKGTLKFQKVSSDILKKIVPEVRGKIKGENPAYAKKLNALISSGKLSKADKIKAKNPVVQANMLFLSGDVGKAVTKSAELCSSGNKAACYNMAVMHMNMETDGKESDESEYYIEAVAVLPGNVTEMLMDNGGLGMGDEATESSVSKRKMQDVLAQAREKMKKKRSDDKYIEKLKTSHVGGRKGSSQEDDGVDETVFMLFWDEVN